ncbi:MAG: small-conductance mechanosensitive channel, partial [Hyphomicrobiales bacterium]|nr:small-conductance mechanosensitive channel [Hyphomicrobiales bacterium]
MLQDAPRRDALIETLQTIAKISTPQPSSFPAPTPAAYETDDAFGAQALLKASAKVEEISDQIAQSVRATTQYPLLWKWLVKTGTDHDSRDLLFGLLWRLATVAGLALLAEYAVRWALRRPFAALAARAAGAASDVGVNGALAHNAGVTRSSGLPLTRLRRSVARLPFAASRLILELAPIAVFAAVGNALLATNIGAEPIARIAILALVNAYVLYRTVMSVVRSLACDRAPETSLFILPGETAAAIETWMGAIVGVTVFGLAFANFARALGLYYPAYSALVKLIVLVAHLLLVVVTLRCRPAVAALIRAPDGRGGLVSVLRNRFADVWHYVAIFANLALWAVWAFRIHNGYSLVVYYAFATVAIFAIARLASVAAHRGLDRALRVRPVSRHPNLEVIAHRYHPALRVAVSTTVAIAAAIALLEAWGVAALTWFGPGEIGAQFISDFSAVAITIIIALLVWEICNGAMERQLARLARDGHHGRAARLRTLLPMLRTVLVVAILTVVGLPVLSAIGVNIAPLLAGAGIVGIA